MSLVMVSQRLTGTAASRFAVAGLAVVLISIGSLALWAAVGGSRSANRLGTAAIATSTRLDMVHTLTSLNLKIDAYDNRPTPAALARVLSAEAAMWAGVQQLETGSPEGRALAHDVLPKLSGFRRAREQWVETVRAGESRRAEAIEDRRLDPLLAGVHEAIERNTADPVGAFRAELDRFERKEAFVSRFTLAALPAGLLLLALCWMVLRGYRRRAGEQARAQLERSEHEATTDPLTGLWNRRRLTADLEACLRRGAASAPRLLMLFDLDGFKLYNDTFGHPAGDALLIRLAAKLTYAVGDRGHPYRMGGDEFCVLVEAGGDDDAVRAELEAALSEHGEGFAITASSGVARIPDEAAGAVAAMQLADRRMYERKGRGRASAGSQARDVLLAALAVRQPELRDHVHEVAALAVAVGRRLGLEPERLDEVGRAAELHDIGKVAVPDAIVNKPGPLSEDEWAFMRRHTVIGEGILAAAPAMLPVARLVRSSHERWDGGGYPDGLAGADIPLGARIVFACDAYDAMTAERVYRAPMSHAAALAELRRCAGSQFDPAVVAALCAVLTGGEAGARTTARPAARR